MSPFFAVIYGGGPLLAYLVLVSLPKGRWALIGQAVTLALLIWLYLHSTAQANPWGQVLALFIGGMAGLAALAQTLRLVLPGWAYLVLVAVLLVAALGAVLIFMGL